MKRRKEYVVFDGKIVLKDKVKINPFIPGVYYGEGFFETIKVKDLEIEYLDEHLKRLKKSCLSFGWNYKKFDYKSLILRLLAKNNMTKGIIRVKIILIKKDNKSAFTFITTDIHKNTKILDNVSLLLNNSVYNAPFSNFKTTSFWYYDYLTNLAQKLGYFSSILQDQNKNITECSNANIILYNNNNSFIVPPDSVKLNGIIEKILIKKLKKLGYKIIKSTIKLENLKNSNLFITNSIIGVKPVKNIIINKKTIISLKINNKILNLLQSLISNL